MEEYPKAAAAAQSCLARGVAHSPLWGLHLEKFLLCSSQAAPCAVLLLQQELGRRNQQGSGSGAAAALSLSPQGQDALGIPSCGLRLGVIFQLSHFPFARGQGLDVPLDLHGNPPEGSPQCAW